MKTRKFKMGGLRDVYDMFRKTPEEMKGEINDVIENKGPHGGTAIFSAYRDGLRNYPCKGVETSIAYAAHAAGVDNSKDFIVWMNKKSHVDILKSQGLA